MRRDGDAAKDAIGGGELAGGAAGGIDGVAEGESGAGEIEFCDAGACAKAGGGLVQHYAGAGVEGAVGDADEGLRRQGDGWDGG